MTAASPLPTAAVEVVDETTHPVPADTFPKPTIRSQTETESAGETDALRSSLLSDSDEEGTAGLESIPEVTAFSGCATDGVVLGETDSVTAAASKPLSVPDEFPSSTSDQGREAQEAADKAPEKGDAMDIVETANVLGFPSNADVDELSVSDAEGPTQSETTKCVGPLYAQPLIGLDEQANDPSNVSSSDVNNVLPGVEPDTRGLPDRPETLAGANSPEEQSRGQCKVPVLSDESIQPTDTHPAEDAGSLERQRTTRSRITETSSAVVATLSRPSEPSGSAGAVATSPSESGPPSVSAEASTAHIENVDNTQPRINSPSEYRPLRHHHGATRPEPTPPPELRLPHRRTRSSSTAPAASIRLPVTRSHCGYCKLQITDGDYSATVLVPQCTIGDAEKLEEESAVQLGPPTPAEERLAQNNMPSVGQLHPVLHTKLSRITGPAMLQPYSTDMSPARDKNASADAERWHVFILEASDGSIEYERTSRRLSTRPSVFKTPEPGRDRRTPVSSTPTSRRKRSFSAATESALHLSSNRMRVPPASPEVVSPVRRSARLRAASQAPSEVSDTQDLQQAVANPSPRRVTRGSKAQDTLRPIKQVDDGPSTSVPSLRTEHAASPSDDLPPANRSRQFKRKLDAPQESEDVSGPKRHNSEQHRKESGPARWDFRRWFR